MKVFMSVARYLFIVSLPFLLLTTVIAAAVNCRWLYTHGFEKYNVRQSLADNGLYLTNADIAEVFTGALSAIGIRVKNILV